MKKYLLIALLIPNIISASIDANLRYGATGNFYSLTLKAVKEYQKSVSITPTGFVGPLTRAKINQELQPIETESIIKEVSSVPVVLPVVEVQKPIHPRTELKTIGRVVLKENILEFSTNIPIDKDTFKIYKHIALIGENGNDDCYGQKGYEVCYDTEKTNLLPIYFVRMEVNDSCFTGSQCDYKVIFSDRIESFVDTYSVIGGRMVKYDIWVASEGSSAQKIVNNARCWIVEPEVEAEAIRDGRIINKANTCQ